MTVPWNWVQSLPLERVRNPEFIKSGHNGIDWSTKALTLMIASKLLSESGVPRRSFDVNRLTINP